MTAASKTKSLRLHAIAGLKIVALMVIFYWHSPLPKVGMPDLGARCVELFFVASGFLVAYARWGRFSGRIDDALDGRVAYAGMPSCSSIPFGSLPIMDFGNFNALQWGGVVPLDRARMLRTRPDN